MSCRQTISLSQPEDFAVYDWGGIFESFWSGMDHNYLYWDIDPTDWEAVWYDYKPKFAALGNSLSADTVNAALTYFEEMTRNFSDGHFVLLFDIDNDGHSDWFTDPANKRVNKRADSKALQFTKSLWGRTATDTTDTDTLGTTEANYNFFEHTIKNYLSLSEHRTNLISLDAFYGISGMRTKSGTGHISIDSTADPNDYILYFYFSDFFWQAEAFPNGEKGPTKATVSVVLKQFMNNLSNDKNVKGIIMDVRGNSGGFNNDVSFLLGPMLAEPLVIAKTRIKSGDGRLQYTPWSDYTIYPAPTSPTDPYGFDVKRSPNAGEIPVVLLVNEYSISCSELMAMAVQQMPKGYVVGQQTWGATGPRMDYTFYTNGGPFNAPLLRVIQAGWATQSVDGKNYEGLGITPNESVLLDWTRFYGDGNGSGRDSQLEAAIKHIDPPHIMP